MKGKSADLIIIDSMREFERIKPRKDSLQLWHENQMQQERDRERLWKQEYLGHFTPVDPSYLTKMPSKGELKELEETMLAFASAVFRVDKKKPCRALALYDENFAADQLERMMKKKPENPSPYSQY